MPTDARSLQDPPLPGPHQALGFVAPSRRHLLARPSRGRKRSETGTADAISPRTTEVAIATLPTHRLRETPLLSRVPQSGGSETGDTELRLPSMVELPLSVSHLTFNFHFLHVPSSVLSLWACVCGGGGVRNKITLHPCPPPDQLVHPGTLGWRTNPSPALP